MEKFSDHKGDQTKCGKEEKWEKEEIIWIKYGARMRKRKEDGEG